MKKNRDVIIIGSGPAGHTAALYASRANLQPLVIEGQEPGGQLTTTTEVENYPGFPQGVMGPELMESMKKQALRFESDYLPTHIKSVDLKNRPFKVFCENGGEYSGKILILSTGASAKYLGLPNERELIGRGVSACATCDAFFFKDKIVHVVGGGDTAMEEANFLTKFAKQVTIVHRRNRFRASQPMQKRTFNNSKIQVLWDSTVVEIFAQEGVGVTGIMAQNVKTGEKTKRPTDGLFMAIGHTPNTAFLNGQVELDTHGFIKTRTPPHPDTNVPGVFACGDVQDSYYRQAITAAGSGCMAAIRAERFLESEKGQI